jgi:hypothetical protein
MQYIYVYDIVKRWTHLQTPLILRPLASASSVRRTNVNAATKINLTLERAMVEEVFID